MYGNPHPPNPPPPPPPLLNHRGNANREGAIVLSPDEEKPFSWGGWALGVGVSYELCREETSVKEHLE